MNWPVERWRADKRPGERRRASCLEIRERIELEGAGRLFDWSCVLPLYMKLGGELDAVLVAVVEPGERVLRCCADRAAAGAECLVAAEGERLHATARRPRTSEFTRTRPAGRSR